MLGGLALKWRWRERSRAAGKPTGRPNLVTGVNVQVCWEKFCRYWDVEPRLVPMERERYHLGAEDAVAMCDENTIGVVAMLDSTFDGSYEPMPAYTFPENRQDLSVLRVVVRGGMFHDMADLFLAALRKQTDRLEALKTPLPDGAPEEAGSFKH
jgi:hypothetical protein